MMDKPVKYVERTCTEVPDNAGDAGQTEDRTESRPLSHYRDHGAYVLLGAPGAGKTVAFKHEAGERGFCDARDFKELGHERWSNVTTLFIDGLDEVRAGTTDGRTPLGAIRQKLDQLGRPRFRLSCREADWFGAADWKRLDSVSPDGVVKVLRLDPLADEDIRTILDTYPQVDDAYEFVAEARDRGLDSLLRNPKSLDMLVQAVSAQHDGAWPGTRTEAFDLACRALVREHNDEHNLAERYHRDISGVLDVAGRLCAVQLLTGSAGYHRVGNQPATDYIALYDLPNANTETLRVVLGSKLFRSPADDRVVPVHRHVAEFLAGRYLSKLVDDGLPVQRVLTLVTGEDGRTVSALRGLAAWFAAHCKAARQEIVERDPLGAILYGDVRSFSVEEKTFLLTCMEQSAGRDPRVFEAMHDLDSRWEDLATPDMEETFREILTRADGTQGRQTVALAVLWSLERDAVIPGIAPMLLDIVRNSECWHPVKEAALKAYVQQCREEDTATDDLKALLADVHEGTVPDPGKDLLGLVLRRLYPKTLRPAEVGRYLGQPEREVIGGLYWSFWEQDLAEQSTDKQLAEVLDSLIDAYRDRGWTRDDGKSVSYWLRTFPTRLLATYLGRSPTVDNKRLFVWLGLAAKHVTHSAKTKINNWLSDHPEAYKAVVRLAADCYADSSQLVYEIYTRLSSAVEPSDFGAWCLVQVVEKERNTEAATEFFLDHVIARQANETISDEFVEKRLAHDPSLVGKYGALRQRRERSIANFTSEQSKSEQRHETEARKRRREWRDAVKDHEQALRENRAAPAILHRLASAYLGQFVDVQGSDGQSRLHELLGDDDLVDMVIEAFRVSTTRSDLPDMTEIFRLADNQKHPLLMLPFLVGLDENPSLRPTEAPLDEQGMRRALAFRFNAPDFWNHKPEWYRAVLKSRPDLVAEVVVLSVGAGLRRGASSGLGLYELGHDNDYQPVAEIAVVPLLRSFPTRCKVEQLHALKLLFNAASRYIDDDTVLEIVENKLALRSMDAAQQMYWIGAGLLVTPALFIDRVRRKFAGRSSERRVRRMAEFLYDCEVPSIHVLNAPELEFLIESLGNSYRPFGWSGEGSEMAVQVTAGNPGYTSLVVDSLINALSSKPSGDATEALERLSVDTALRPWHLKLRDAAGRQREVRREVNYRHASVEQVQETLDNGRPANPADLAALARYILYGLKKEIRHGDTSDWRQYWNVDSYNHAQDPKPEDACRDALLSDLKARLAPLGVDAQPEGTYADDKRSDIRVSCDGFNVPIEIKKSKHDDLWRAIRNQLIAKYTCDPRCGGYGIYLVFWFGRDRDLCKRPPTGSRPETPDALHDQLLTAANLSPAERSKISVCVIDVSKPD